MEREDLNVLSAFLAVAEERNFTRAAKRLNVSQSALSHAIRALEERLDVRLLSRTTRSVAPTDAGTELIASLAPALTDIRGALAKLSGRRSTPAGRVRVVAPRLVTTTILAAKLGEFARRYPDVVLDITTEDGPIDVVAGGFDAGIQFGEYIAQDMVAVRVSPDHRPAIVGSREYFKSHPKPKSPRDLVRHRCINFRHGSQGMYRWEFDKGKQSLSIAVAGPLIVDDTELVIRAALDGVGLAFVAEQHAEPHLSNGRFVRVLQDWCPPFPGYFLYYPSRRQQPAALSALIDILRFAETPRAPADR